MLDRREGDRLLARADRADGGRSRSCVRAACRRREGHDAAREDFLVAALRNADGPVRHRVDGDGAAGGDAVTAATARQAQKITPCLWFDFNAEEAVNHYVGIFK